jgi:hypothetical protein
MVVQPGTEDVTHHIEVMLYCNLKCLEQSITGRADRMLDLMEKFAELVDPSNAQMDLSVLNQHVRGEKATIWFRVKNLSPDGKSQDGSPGLDVGFTLLAPDVDAVKWIDIHMMMHQCEDIDIVHQYAHKESWSLTGFGMSIANAPEQRYILSPPEYSRNYMLSSFLFFRELGFVKPNQGVMVALTEADPKETSIQAVIGAEGLVRLGVQAWSPRSDTSAWLKAVPGCSKHHKPEVTDIYGVSRLFASLPEEFQMFGDKKGFGMAVTWRQYEVITDGVNADSLM